MRIAVCLSAASTAHFTSKNATTEDKKPGVSFKKWTPIIAVLLKYFYLIFDHMTNCPGKHFDMVNLNLFPVKLGEFVHLMYSSVDGFKSE